MENINQFILYTGEDGDVKLKLFLEDETLWLPQKLIGDLFQVESHTINYHIKRRSRHIRVNRKCQTNCGDYPCLWN